ncbi:MAG: hypothetical protein AAF208_00690 [Cyanobacteria bacterium P01_A01_bin.45]
MSNLTAPSTESCNVVRRDHLTASEVRLLIEAMKNQDGWYSFRNISLFKFIFLRNIPNRICN